MDQSILFRRGIKTRRITRQEVQLRLSSVARPVDSSDYEKQKRMLFFLRAEDPRRKVEIPSISKLPFKRSSREVEDRVAADFSELHVCCHGITAVSSFVGRLLLFEERSARVSGKVLPDIFHASSGRTALPEPCSLDSHKRVAPPNLISPADDIAPI